MRIPLAFLFFLLCSSLFSQNIALKLEAKDSFQLKVIQVFPDSFPVVSTVFKAENKLGEPLWLLDKSQLSIKENQQNCKLISLRRITKEIPIKVGLVIDHSGSMLEDYYQLIDTTTNQPLYTVTDTGVVLPENYIAPIVSAKLAVSEFISSLNREKDSVQIVGFSSVVDSIGNFTNDTLLLNSQVNGLTAEGGTALYDAMYASLKNLSEEEGIKVLIALTDGMDNSSSNSAASLLDSAVNYNIPIYNVALGSAVIDSLILLSDSTGGSFYYSRSALTLSEIYQKISRKILAVYELKHLSENFSSADTLREFELQFTVDSLLLFDNTLRSKLPEPVIWFLKEKENSVLKQYAIYGGIGLSVLLLWGGFYLRNKRGRKSKIITMFPNPVKDLVTIEFVLQDGIESKLQIIDVRKQQKVEVPISGISGKVTTDVSMLSRGVLLVRLIDSSGTIGKAIKLLKK